MASKCKSKVCNPDGAGAGAGAAATCDVSPELIEKTQELILTDDHMKQYRANLLDCIQRGLKKETHADSSVKCFPTYVQDLPDGTEKGKFLALDLGGSNFRVLLVTLSDDGSYDQQFKIYSISQETMTGSGDQLFDFIAQCLSDFVIEQGVQEEILPLGFTFSFPLEQKGLCVGVLQHWTKGFDCDGVVGQDVVSCLKDALQRRGDVKIEVCAVLNDTTGTLMSCAWKNRDTRIGLIIGTGTNACYLESQANSELFDEPDMGSGKVIINLEWGGFGDGGELDFCRTAYDEEVSKIGPNTGWTHERMISGMYLGELVRLAMVRFTSEGIMFGGTGSDQLSTQNEFLTRFVSEILEDPVGSYDKVKKICDDLGLGHATEQDYKSLRYLCEIFSQRAAYLVSAGISVLLEKVGEKKSVVGVDGTLFKNHPNFKNLMNQKIRELTDPSIDFELMLSEDGSGRGAAIVAAVAARIGGPSP